MPVVGNVCHLVGTKAVLLCDPIYLLPAVVGDDQSLILLYQRLQSAVEYFCLGNAFLQHISLPALKSRHIHDVAVDARLEIGISLLLELQVAAAHFVDDIVAGHNLHRAILLIDLHHLTCKQPDFPDALHEQLAIGLSLEKRKEIVASHPNAVVARPIHHRHSSVLRCMDDAPLRPVIIQQSLEVGHEHRAVLPDLDIEIPVVCPIFRCRIVTDQRQTLRSRG